MLASYAKIIRRPRYRAIWIGQLVSSLGDTINYVALVVDIFKMSGSGTALSTLVLFQIVSVLLAGPIAGPSIDRFPRKYVLIAADLVRAGLAFGLIVASTVWQIYSIAFCLALASVFFSPALSASIPSLVEGEDLLAASAVSWSTAQLVQIIGSAASGGIIALFGVSMAFAFNGTSFLISALSISLIAFPAVERVAAGSFLRSAWEGLRFARRDPFVWAMLKVQILASLAVGATSALLVVLAERRYQLPAAGFASFLGAIGLGALLGPILLGSLTRRYWDRRFLFLPYIMRGAGDVLLGLLTVPLLGELLLFVYGLNTSTGMVTYQTVMQKQVPDEVRGRVFTVMDVGWNLARIVSVALGGILADRFGIAVVYYGGGMMLIAAGVLGLLTVRLDAESH